VSDQPGYQRGDRIALEYTADPRTRLQPGDEGTVTGYDPRHGQFSDCSVPSDASELRFYVADMPVTLSNRLSGLMIRVTTCCRKPGDSLLGTFISGYCSFAAKSYSRRSWHISTLW
jgi:hypothetical protein